MKWHFGIAGVGMENWKLVATQLDIRMACQVARTPWRATSAFVTASRSFQGESKSVNLNNTQSWWRFVSCMDAYWSLLMVQVSLNTQLYYARCVFQALWRPMTVSDDVYQNLSLHSWFLSIVLRWLAKCVTILFSHIHTRMQRIRLHTLAFNILQWLKVTFAFPIWQSF